MATACLIYAISIAEADYIDADADGVVDAAGDSDADSMPKAYDVTLPVVKLKILMAIALTIDTMRVR